MQKNLNNLVLRSIYQNYVISTKNLVRTYFDGKPHKYQPKYRINELEIPNIKYHLHSNTPWVIYKHTGFCNQKILLKKVACNFGKYRYFFLCPECNTSRYNLYYDNKTKSFKCFVCSKLIYLSQRITKSDYYSQDTHMMFKIDLIKAQTRRTTHKGDYTKRWKTYLKALEKCSDTLNELSKPN